MRLLSPLAGATKRHARLECDESSIVNLGIRRGLPVSGRRVREGLFEDSRRANGSRDAPGREHRAQLLGTLPARSKGVTSNHRWIGASQQSAEDRSVRQCATL